MANEVIKMEHISKEYHLGQIGGGTLNADLQSWWARIRGKEDPNQVLGEHSGKKADTFMALDDITLSVYQGDRLGIIGHNGAGKSTLLKILSRVTAPSEGSFRYKGRIASMLEVGTGFHPELTGRENVYLNGAILGMGKSEISEKFEDIVTFAELEKFIDTPVKRYSSGMYVKLAFAVAAHLDSEILVMDEVLAVGDMKFQQKCLGKMDDVAETEGRTVLYVSHNMNTIRQLCNRCIVLDHGKVVFDGDTEQAIGIYSDINTVNLATYHDCKKMVRTYLATDKKHVIDVIEILEKEEAVFSEGEKIHLSIRTDSKEAAQDLCFRMMIKYIDDSPAGMATSPSDITVNQGETETKLLFDMGCLAEGTYKVRIALYSVNEYGTEALHDVLDCGFTFVREPNFEKVNNLTWNHGMWGHMSFPPIEVLQ